MYYIDSRHYLNRNTIDPIDPLNDQVEKAYLSFERHGVLTGLSVPRTCDLYKIYLTHQT